MIILKYLDFFFFYDIIIIREKSKMMKLLTTKLAGRKGKNFLENFQKDGNLIEWWYAVKNERYQWNSTVKDMEVVGVAR